MASISNDEDASLADKITFIRIMKKENDDVKLPDQKLVEGTPLLSIEEQAIAAEERNNKKEPFNYDNILGQHIGQFGKFQWRILLWLCIPAFLNGPIAMKYTFTGVVPFYTIDLILI